MKKLLAALLAAAMLLSLAACGNGVGEAIDEILHHDSGAGGGVLSDAGITGLSAESSENVLRAAVLYDGASESADCGAIMSRMKQPLLLNFQAETVDVSGEFDLSGFDLLYPDESVITAANAGDVRDAVENFARDGGGVFLTNGFSDFFERGFIGARATRELDTDVASLVYPELDGDLAEIQDVVRDYAALLGSFGDGAVTGQGVMASDAVSIVSAGGVSLYTVNEYGDGYVFFTSTLLPTDDYITNTDLEGDSAGTQTLEMSALSAARLIEAAFASFYAKRTVGFSVWRVYGCFGRPSMAWQYSIEESRDILDGGAKSFAETAQSYLQAPSYSLARSVYTAGYSEESVTCYLGQSADTLAFTCDYYEDVCSSGTHIAAGDGWLRLESVSSGDGSGAEDSGLRAYPYVADIDGDGDMDIISGSSDGYIWFFDGEGFNGTLLTAEGVALTNASGTALSVEGYSAPVLYDFNGDGVADILCGAADGGVYLFTGAGDMTYTFIGRLVDTGFGSQALPDVGDLNGDGFADLVVGGDCGRLLVWYGGASGFVESEPEEIRVFGVDGDWLAPRIADLDGDGSADLAIGTRQGYVARLLWNGSSFAAAGFIERGELNDMGESNVTTGVNCVPFFADINADGMTDLICGSLEYGAACPIDSSLFPYAAALSETTKYILGSGWYIGARFRSGRYASVLRETKELGYQLAALNTYKVYTEATADMGSSQLGWYTAVNDVRQTFLSLWEAGLLWSSGFTSAGAADDPTLSAGNALCLPFYLTVGDSQTLLIKNTGTVLAGSSDWNAATARWSAPALLYYGCSSAVGEGADALFKTAEAFRETYNYGFVMENQLMHAAAAAENLTASVSGGPGEGFAVTLSAGEELSAGRLYNWSYQNSSGARISLGTALADKNISTDASVWYRDGNELYISLDKRVSVYESDTAQTGAHIICVNLPASITLRDGGAAIQFADSGLMQITVEGDASTPDAGWAVTQYGGRTMFSRYGDEATINIVWQKNA